MDWRRRRGPIREKTNLRRSRSLEITPYENTTHGNGAIIVVKPAKRAVAPTVPSREYIARANNGKTAAKVDLIVLFAAIAEAAIGL